MSSWVNVGYGLFLAGHIVVTLLGRAQLRVEVILWCLMALLLLLAITVLRDAWEHRKSRVQSLWAGVRALVGLAMLIFLVQQLTL